MTHAIEARGLSKRYRKQKWALQDCSFHLPAGRIAALVGPNGAGKTTLLHIAVGLLGATAGEIRVLGGKPAENEEMMSRVGFVAQDTPLYENFTGEDLIAFGAHTNRRWDGDFARERLRRLQIPVDQRASTLSGGQRAQLALALALAKRPELLLLDEPLASLDPLARREFLGTLMESAAEDEITVLLSSHLITDLERVCDFLLILSNGRLQLGGAIEDLVDTHRVLVGPRRTGAARRPIAGVSRILDESVTGRQATLVARIDGPIIDPKWECYEVTLEDIVLAYLGQKDTPPETTSKVKEIAARRAQ
jgi:ABC-2 type transport system ATP-binding protein